MPIFEGMGAGIMRGLDAGMSDAERRQRMRQAQADADYQAQTRPLALLGSQLALNQQKLGLRGQILGSGETGDDYLQGMNLVRQYDLPTADLPEVRSTAWNTFKAPEVAPEAPKVGASWLPQGWFPGQNINLPAPEVAKPSTALPQGAMVDPNDLTAVQRAAQRGLPLKDQEKMQDSDIGRQIQLATLARLRDKDSQSQRWLDFQREAKVQGMTEAETQRAFQREMARLGYNLDISKFAFQKDIETAKAATGKTPNEGQSKAALFGGQIFEGKSDMEQLLADGFNPTEAFDAAGSMLAGSALNSLASEKAQLWRQAVDRVTNAALRYESGAAIGEQESARKIKETVPKYGDSPAVVRSKMRTIEQIISGLETAAGPAGASVRGGAKTAPADPKTGTITPQQFSAAWAKARPGDVLTGPDGKKYKKGGK